VVNVEAALQVASQAGLFVSNSAFSER
jgi:hypothetical protein